MMSAVQRIGRFECTEQEAFRRLYRSLPRATLTGPGLPGHIGDVIGDIARPVSGARWTNKQRRARRRRGPVTSSAVLGGVRYLLALDLFRPGLVRARRRGAPDQLKALRGAQDPGGSGKGERLALAAPRRGCPAPRGGSPRLDPRSLRGERARPEARVGSHRVRWHAPGVPPRSRVNGFRETPA